MLRRAHVHLSSTFARPGAALLAGLTLLVVPAVSLAAATTSQPTAHPANHPESTSGDGITVNTWATGLLSWQVKFSGTAPSRFAGRTIQIQRTAQPGSRSWVPAAQATIAHGGSWVVDWTANQSGRLSFRAILLRRQTTASAAATSPSLPVTVYRLSRASWYGPGFFGHRTACGETLRKTTLGVANRSLKCGAKVSVYYNGHAITVPVIDRGPYTRGVYWDLTQATAQALKMTETTHVGTLYRR